jgi:hypothetical protein
MSFIYSDKLKYDNDSANIDAFGRLRVSELTSLMEVSHIYDKNPLLVDEIISGGTSVYEATNSCVTMTTGASAQYVVRQTKSSAVYQPGKGQQTEFSFSDFAKQTNVIKRVGYYTSAKTAPYNSSFDGFFLESNGVTNDITFQIWKSGTLTASSSISSWDNSIIDPTTIDFNKCGIMFVDFQWLGVGRLRFGLVLEGKIYIFYSHTGANNLSDVYMTNPNKPIRYEIRQAGPGSGEFHMICAQVSTEGSAVQLSRQTGTYSLSTNLTTADTKYPIIGFRIGSTYAGVNAYLENVIVNSTSADDFALTVELNPTLSSTPTWTVLPNTPVEGGSAASTITVTSSGTILHNVIGKGNQLNSYPIPLKEIAIKPGFSIGGTADQVWICITPLSANADYRVAQNILYWY